MTKISIYLYKKGNGIVPNGVGVYGSASKAFYIKEHFSVDAFFDIKRSEIKALDKPSQRCDASNKNPTLSKCVGCFIENNLNCSLQLLMSDSMVERCNHEKLGQQDLKLLDAVVRRLDRQEESEIFEKTGCTPACSKSKFELNMNYFQEDNSTDMEIVTIRLKYPYGEYEVTEEYFLYDMDSFIPDVGGYLGLLLGYSLLSMYHSFTQCLPDFKQWLLNTKLVATE